MPFQVELLNNALIGANFPFLVAKWIAKQSWRSTDGTFCSNDRIRLIQLHLQTKVLYLPRLSRRFCNNGCGHVIASISSKGTCDWSSTAEMIWIRQGHNILWLPILYTQDFVIHNSRIHKYIDCANYSPLGTDRVILWCRGSILSRRAKTDYNIHGGCADNCPWIFARFQLCHSAEFDLILFLEREISRYFFVPWSLGCWITVKKLFAFYIWQDCHQWASF